MLESFDSKAILIFRWHSWKSPILVGLLVVAMVLSIGGKSMIINYIARFAPRGRPINIMIMIDQVVSVKESRKLKLIGFILFSDSCTGSHISLGINGLPITSSWQHIGKLDLTCRMPCLLVYNHLHQCSISMQWTCYGCMALYGLKVGNHGT